MIKLKDFPRFPTFKGKWTDSSVVELSRFLKQLRDYLTVQPIETILVVEFTGTAAAPTKLLDSQVKPIGVTPLAFEKLASEAGYVSEPLPNYPQWSWDNGTISFPTLAGLSGTYRLRVLVREGS
jgi:hypothetical protein